LPQTGIALEEVLQISVKHLRLASSEDGLRVLCHSSTPVASQMKRVLLLTKKLGVAEVKPC